VALPSRSKIIPSELGIAEPDEALRVVVDHRQCARGLGEPELEVRQLAGEFVRVIGREALDVVR
jgi:hypothetical protein